MSVPDRIRRVIRKRVRARDRFHQRHLGGAAKREARLIRGLRRRLLAWTAPRTQFDAVTLANVPGEPRAVAAYINGAYANVEEAKRRFPDALITTISVRSSDDAHVLDIEPGDADNIDAVDWIRHHDHAKYGKPILYTSASNVAALVAVLKDAGFKRRQYILWGAHYTDKRHVCGRLTCGYPKVDCTQFTTHDERVDESKCRPSYWRR